MRDESMPYGRLTDLPARWLVATDTDFQTAKREGVLTGLDFMYEAI